MQAYGMPQKPMGGGMPPGGMPPGGAPPGGGMPQRSMGGPPAKKEVFSPEQMVEIRRIIQQELRRRK